jgi:uncharacterized protein (DUF3084 family)
MKLDALDPHAKDDISRFQQKLKKVDKQLQKLLEEKATKNKEYRCLKEEYLSTIQKKKALQSTFMHIMD